MPFSTTIQFISLDEQFEFDGLTFPAANYSKRQPVSVSPSGGEGSVEPYRWVRICTISLEIDSKYEFGYTGRAFSGFDYANNVCTVTETWTKLSGNPWSATYVTVTNLQNLITGELGNSSIDSINQIRFNNDIYSGPNGFACFSILSNVEVFGEPVLFYAHSFSSNGITITAGTELSCSIPSYPVGQRYARIGSQSGWWRPSTEFHVKFSPTDLDGNEVSKSVLVYIGEMSRLGEESFGDGNITGADTVTEYLKELNTPVDSTYEFAGRGVRYTRAASISGTALITGSSTYGGDLIQCNATQCRIYYRYANFGITPAAYPFYECRFPMSMPIYHLFDEDADVTNIEAAVVQLPSSKALTTGAWTASGTGASVAGDQLTAASTQGTFENLLSPITFYAPYRWLAFDYVVSSGTPSVEVETQGANAGIAGFYSKRFAAGTLSGSGTAYIDVLKPSSINGTAASSLPRLLQINQAQANPAGDDGNRFGGLVSLYAFRVRFTNAVVTITNVRMVVRTSASLAHRVGTSDGGAGQTQHFMAGHVDGRDAFRVDAATIQTVVNRLRDWQGLTIVSTNYARPSHSPVTTLATQSSVMLAVQDAGGSLQADQNVLTSASIRASVSSTSGIAFFYGLVQLGWFNTVQAIGIWGNEATATTPGSDKPTSVKIIKATDPIFDFDYDTNAINFGRKNLPDHRYLRTTYPIDVEHYIPRHPAPQTKATYNLYSNGRRFHIYATASAPGLTAVSYDVSSSLTHYRAYLIDGVVQTGRADNDLTWVDTDSGIEAESVCIRVDRRDKTQRLYLWVGTTDARIVRYLSDDEGETWGMATEIGTGTMPFADIGLNGRRYVYRFDGTDVIGQIYDASDQLLEADFTAISDVEEDGGSAHESVERGGKHRIVIYVKQDGNIQGFTSYDGKTFT